MDESDRTKVGRGRRSVATGGRWIDKESDPDSRKTDNNDETEVGRSRGQQQREKKGESKPRSAFQTTKENP